MSPSASSLPASTPSSSSVPTPPRRLRLLARRPCPSRNAESTLCKSCRILETRASSSSTSVSPQLYLHRQTIPIADPSPSVQSKNVVSTIGDFTLLPHLCWSVRVHSRHRECTSLRIQLSYHESGQESSAQTDPSDQLLVDRPPSEPKCAMTRDADSSSRSLGAIQDSTAGYRIAERVSLLAAEWSLLLLLDLWSRGSILT